MNPFQASLYGANAPPKNPQSAQSSNTDTNPASAAALTNPPTISLSTLPQETPGLVGLFSPAPSAPSAPFSESIIAQYQAMLSDLQAFSHTQVQLPPQPQSLFRVPLQSHVPARLPIEQPIQFPFQQPTPLPMQLSIQQQIELLIQQSIISPIEGNVTVQPFEASHLILPSTISDPVPANTLHPVISIRPRNPQAPSTSDTPMTINDFQPIQLQPNQDASTLEWPTHPPMSWSTSQSPLVYDTNELLDKALLELSLPFVDPLSTVSSATSIPKHAAFHRSYNQGSPGHHVMPALSTNTISRSQTSTDERQAQPTIKDHISLVQMPKKIREGGKQQPSSRQQAPTGARESRAPSEPEPVYTEMPVYQDPPEVVASQESNPEIPSPSEIIDKYTRMHKLSKTPELSVMSQTIKEVCIQQHHVDKAAFTQREDAVGASSISLDSSTLAENDTDSPLSMMQDDADFSRHAGPKKVTKHHYLQHQSKFRFRMANNNSSAIQKEKAKQYVRPLNPYILFCSDWRDIYRHENPSLNTRQLAATLGQAWHKLSDVQREEYIHRAELNKKSANALASNEDSPANPLNPLTSETGQQTATPIITPSLDSSALQHKESTGKKAASSCPTALSSFMASSPAASSVNFVCITHDEIRVKRERDREKRRQREEIRASSKKAPHSTPPE